MQNSGRSSCAGKWITDKLLFFLPSKYWLSFTGTTLMGELSSTVTAFPKNSLERGWDQRNGLKSQQ